MTFTNLEKYVYSKNDVNLPQPSLQQSRRYFRAEKVTWLPLLFVI